MKQDQSFHASLESGDDEIINPSQQASLTEVVSQGRRNLLKGGAALAITSLLSSVRCPVLCPPQREADHLLTFNQLLQLPHLLSIM